MPKFMKYYVESDEGKKSKVFYWLDARGDEKPCINICAREYGNQLSFLPNVDNKSDSSVDYFEKDRAVLFEDYPGYTEIRAKILKYLGW